MKIPIHIDTIRMELSILYFEGWQVEISKLWYISVPEVCFYLDNQSRPWWNAALCGISSGSSLFAKVPVDPYPEWKGLNFYLMG